MCLTKSGEYPSRYGYQLCRGSSFPPWKVTCIGSRIGFLKRVGALSLSFNFKMQYLFGSNPSLSALFFNSLKVGVSIIFLTSWLERCLMDLKSPSSLSGKAIVNDFDP